MRNRYHAIGLFLAIMLCSCGLLKQKQVVPVIQMTAEQCVTIARAYCRPDIALACQTAKDLAPLFEQLLGETQGADGQCK